MIIFGKVAGFLFGFMIAAFPGAFVGLVIGHFFDMSLKKALRDLHGKTAEDLTQTQKIFFKTTFEVMGYLAKVDGRVSEQEIKTAGNIMAHLDLNEAKRLEAIECFNLGKSDAFDFLKSLEGFKTVAFRNLDLRHIFLEIQLTMAYADTIITPAERQAIETICSVLKIPPMVLRQLESRFQAEQKFQYRTKTHTSRDKLVDAFGVLGLPKTASFSETKKAYRRLMSEHHPDKLAAKGLPESMIPIAKEKTQTIQNAYEVICQAKGWR